MASYRYIPLSDPLVDIRVLTLLPGKFDDEIRLRIAHVPFSEPVGPLEQRFTLKELRRTVPSDAKFLRLAKVDLCFSFGETEIIPRRILIRISSILVMSFPSMVHFLGMSQSSMPYHTCGN
jgi:hypothetical protein